MKNVTHNFMICDICSKAKGSRGVNHDKCHKIRLATKPHKICSSCKESRSYDLFGKHPRDKSGLQSWCKYCQNNKQKQRNAKRINEYQDGLSRRLHENNK